MQTHVALFAQIVFVGGAFWLKARVKAEDMVKTRTGDEHQGEWPISGVRPILGTWSIPGGVANTRCETNTGDMVYTRGEWPTPGVRPILGTWP